MWTDERIYPQGHVMQLAPSTVNYESRKNVKGREVRSLVDTLGSRIRPVVDLNRIQDRDGAVFPLDEIDLRFPWPACVFAETGFYAWQTSEQVAGFS